MIFLMKSRSFTLSLVARMSSFLPHQKKMYGIHPSPQALDSPWWLSLLRSVPATRLGVHTHHQDGQAQPSFCQAPAVSAASRTRSECWFVGIIGLMLLKAQGDQLDKTFRGSKTISCSRYQLWLARVWWKKRRAWKWGNKSRQAYQREEWEKRHMEIPVAVFSDRIMSLSKKVNLYMLTKNVSWCVCRHARACVEFICILHFCQLDTWKIRSHCLFAFSCLFRLRIFLKFMLLVFLLWIGFLYSLHLKKSAFRSFCVLERLT